MTGRDGWNRVDVVGDGTDLPQAVRTLLDGVADFVMTVDDSGTVLYAGEGVENVLGYDPQGVVGETVEALLADGEHDDNVAGGRSGDDTVRFQAADGAGIHAEVSVAPRPAGDGAVWLVRDVSDQWARDRELERYVELVETVGDPMYILDGDGTIEQVNDAMVEYTGYTTEELEGRSITELVPSSEYDRVTRWLTDPDEDVSDPETFETTLVTSDGERILSEANITLLRNDHGETVGTVGVLRDIRERKRREQDLHMLKEVLTRVFRHNIRNELMVVQAHTELIEATVDADVDEQIAEIAGAIDSLLQYSEKAREIERVMESPGQVNLDLETEIGHAVASVEETHPGAAVDVADISEGQVRAHPKIGTAIEELLDNAIRHTPPEREPAVRIWTDEHEESVTVFVEDNAGGLDESEIAVLRQGIETDLEHSSGVGLWLVRWIVEYSGAELLTHRTDDGSLMGLRLPTDAAEETSTGRLDRHSPNIRPPAALDRLYDETFVGRVEELRELRRVYDTLERTGGHAVFVTGGPGMGKSTLVEEFLDDVTDHESAPLVGSATCKPGVSPPYHVVGEALSSLPVETESMAPVVDGGTFGHDPDAVADRRQEVFADIATELRELAADRPVVIVLEDLHWADQETVDFVEFLRDEVLRWAPSVLVVGTCRRAETAGQSPIADLLAETDDAGRQTTVGLDPLEPAHVKQLLEQVLDTESVPDAFVEAVHDHTGGTPMFVTELARHFVETLGSEPDPDELPVDFEDVTVPESVERAVTARLDALLDPVVSILELGAVAGESVTLDVLRAASSLPDTELLEYTNRLVVHRLWEQHEDEYRFVHGAIRQQALDHLDESHRERLHGQLAEAIEDVYADTLDEQYGRLASHYRAAGRPELAFEYYHKAGEQASDQFAYRTALGHFEAASELARDHDCADEEAFAAVLAQLARGYVTAGRFDEARETTDEGLSLAPEASHLTCRLLSTRADALAQQGRFDEAQSLVERMRELTIALEDHKLVGQATQQLGSIAFRTSNLDDAREYHREGLEIFRELGDKKAEAKSLHHLGMISHNQSRFEEAREYHESALELFDELGDRRGKAQSFTNLGLIEQKRGDKTTAKGRHERSLELFRDIGDTYGEAAALNNLGLIARDEAEYEQAREYYAESYELSTDMGDRQTAAIAVDNLGVVTRRQGRYEQARTHHQQALDIYRDIDDRLGVAISQANLGHVDLFCGVYESARAHLNESLDIVQEIGDRYREVIVRARLGELGLRVGDIEAASEQYERTHELASTIDNDEYAAKSRRGLAAIARRTGEYERADRLLNQATDYAESSGTTEHQVRTTFERVRLDLDRGDWDGALARLIDSERRVEECGQPYIVGQFHGLRGDATSERDPDSAREHYQQALDVFDDLGVPAEVLDTLCALVEVCRETDHVERARAYRQRANERLADSPDPVSGEFRERVEACCGRLDGPES